MSPEYVSMPVPVDRVQEVYELLARPRDEPGASTAAGGGRPLRWSADLLRRAYDESSVAMKTVLDTLATRPGQTVRVAELADVLGLERGKLAGVLGAFGRRWKNRYRQGEANLPFKAHWSADAGMTVYEMDEPVAAVLRRVAPAAR